MVENRNKTVKVHVRRMIVSIVLLLGMIFISTAQTKSWYSVFHTDAEFKYVTNFDSDPATNWREVGFDDSNWNEGVGGIGYGDGDDGTVINGVSAVFLRKSFVLQDLSNIKQIAISVDYDDAFVAYLNGIEIARSAGLEEEYPGLDALSSVQHEAELYRGGTPETFIFDDSEILSLLNSQSNVLAIQVHNASNTSSDFSSSVWLHVGLSKESTDYLSTPSWFSAPVDFLGDLESNLPIVIIETESQQQISDEPKVTAHMGIINNGPGNMNSIDDAYNEYDGYIGIEHRGNSTQNYPKKPFDLETRDENGENLNVSLLGMPEENDWILRASYFDHTFIRNSLASHMSMLLGNWASRTRHVELVVNGEYLGIYLLMEQIKKDENRLDIATLKETDIDGEEVTGGYIWKVDGFQNEFGNNRNLVYPKSDEITSEQLNYIRNSDDAFRNLMSRSSRTYSDPNSGYVSHINVKSFINEVIVQEAMRNSDAYAWSAYFYKDKNELISAGPVWDFDQSAGNSSYPDDADHTQWLIEHFGKQDVPDFWRKLIADPFFKYSLKLRWEEMRATSFSNERLFAFIDSIAAELTVPQTREFTKWNVLGQFIWRETTGFEQRDTYQKEVDYLKEFLNKRWQWMDDQLEGVSMPTGYPEITIENLESFQIEIGQEKTYLPMQSIFSYPYASGLNYLVKVENENILEARVNSGDSLRLEPFKLGSTNIHLTCTDTYGNSLETSLFVEVVKEVEQVVLKVDPGWKFHIYPNPTTGSVKIETQKMISSINILDLSGKLIKQFKSLKTSQLELNLEDLESGTYMLDVLMSEKSRYQIRFLKQ